MTSSKKSKPAKSSDAVFVEKLETFERLLLDDIDLQEDAFSRQSNSSELASTSKKSIHSYDHYGKSIIADMREKEEKSLQRTREIIERSVRRGAEKKAKIFSKNIAEVEEAKSFLDSVDQYLKMNSETNFNNSRRQFEEWNMQVHGKIQMKISKQLNAMDPKALNKKKNDDYEKFLDISNRKPAIFRDIIIESEYDPLEPNRHSIKARTARLKDPTLMLLRKNVDEAAMLNDTGTVKCQSINSRTKATLPVELWASGKIEGTPHGRFMKMMNTKSKLTDTMTSKLVFDDYNFKKGKDVVDTEMPKGKRAYPVGIGWDKDSF